MKDNAVRMRLLTGMVLVILFMMPFAHSGMASEQSDIRNNAIQLRLTIARFDLDLQKRIRDALQAAPDRVIHCKNGPDTLANCFAGPYRNLARPAVTLKSGSIDQDAASTPLNDVRTAEERYALYNERMNKTNDLLSRAGLPLYIPQRDLTPDIDDLRKRILTYMENRQTSDLRYEKLYLILGVLAVLAAIFGALYLLLRRFKG